MVAAGQGKNRRAFGDISNLITLNGKPMPEISRPLTRSYRAQLLANAAENKEKPLAVNVDNNKLVQPEKKPTIKPKPAPVSGKATVIKISPDTEKTKAQSSSSRNKNLKNPSPPHSLPGAKLFTTSSGLQMRHCTWQQHSGQILGC
ncbi:hypothetical protein L1987_57653 [Smallanthus sonchifolius]|uniref:Uncharacterized protein n=1 Tax=Smallanthus sonchifolius TaxID=185202 RepID=A0ACB9DD75_9ASTR|nr:hypothetical protein L1987_57653 [Smallanthus sonchifolius]